MINTTEYLSPHITIKEAIKSITADRLNIINVPDQEQLDNMMDLALEVFEPLREGLGRKPISIPSFFRSEKLNKIIGGALNSQHMANKGAAIDLDVDGSQWLYNYQIFEFIKDYLTFDQIIWEFGDKYNPNWIHVSYNRGQNRKQILRALRENGKTKYIKWS